MARLSHIDGKKKAVMVDVSSKYPSSRTATVYGKLTLSHKAIEAMDADIFNEIRSTSIVAGLQAAKQTPQLVPFCHQVQLEDISIGIELNREQHEIEISVQTKSSSKTGVEIEAMIACQISSTCIYDMIKAIDPNAVLGPFMLVQKKGGNSDIN